MPEGPAGGPRPLAENSITLKHFKLTGEYQPNEVSEIERNIRNKQDIRADVSSTTDEFDNRTVLKVIMPTNNASLSALQVTKDIIGDVIGEDVENHNVVVFSDKEGFFV